MLNEGQAFEEGHLSRRLWRVTQILHTDCAYVIPEKRDQAANRRKKGSGDGWPVSHDADLYKERNTVERLINRLKAWRGIATRYDCEDNGAVSVVT